MGIRSGLIYRRNLVQVYKILLVSLLIYKIIKFLCRILYLIYIAIVFIFDSRPSATINPKFVRDIHFACALVPHIYSILSYYDFACQMCLPVFGYEFYYIYMLGLLQHSYWLGLKNMF